MKRQEFEFRQEYQCNEIPVSTSQLAYERCCQSDCATKPRMSIQGACKYGTG